VIDSGDIYIADLGDEQPRRGLVLSSAQFHSRSGRVLLAPERTGPPFGVEPPWHVAVDGDVFAIDLLLTVREENLLRQVGRAPYGAVAQARRALIAIT
jgi:hypothetical protein